MLKKTNIFVNYSYLFFVFLGLCQMDMKVMGLSSFWIHVDNMKPLAN